MGKGQYSLPSWAAAAAAVVLACVLLPFISADADDAAASGADAIELVSDERLTPRLHELTLSTPEVAEDTGVRVLLPEGYAAHPKRDYPVLYLLHGAVDDYRSWSDKGDVEAITAGSELIVVMPDSGAFQGYVDWFNAGRFGPPAWETYHVGELIPWIDDNYRTLAARRGRAIAGLSMGGGGAMHYAAKHPGTFVFAAGYSPAVDIRDPSLIALNQAVPGPDGTPSPAYGPYATEEIRWHGENPLDLAENLRGMTLSLRTGNGQPGGEFGGSGDPIEESVHRMATAMHERLDELGIAHTFEDYGAGSHDWPYWQRDLRLDLPSLMETFADPPRPPRRFSFLSIDPTYADYGWRVRMIRPELELSRLRVTSRKRFRLSGSGTGVVRTPPRLRPDHDFLVTLRGPESPRRQLILHSRHNGTLRIPLSLGIPNPDQQFTPEAEVNGTNVFTKRVRIRKAP